MRRLLAFAFLIVSAACASSPERRQQIVVEEAGRLKPIETPLKSFGRFELQPIELSPEVAGDTSKAALGKELGDKLQARLDPVFKQWSEAAPEASRGRTLSVQPTVVKLRVVSGGARFFVGALAGDSNVDMDLKLVEKETGKVVALERISKNASGMAGGWSVGSSDRNLSDYVVDIAHRYLLDNYQR